MRETESRGAREGSSAGEKALAFGVGGLSVKRHTWASLRESASSRSRSLLTLGRIWRRSSEAYAAKVEVARRAPRRSRPPSSST